MSGSLTSGDVLVFIGLLAVARAIDTLRSAISAALTQQEKTDAE